MKESFQDIGTAAKYSIPMPNVCRMRAPRPTKIVGFSLSAPNAQSGAASTYHRFNVSLNGVALLSGDDRLIVGRMPLPNGTVFDEIDGLSIAVVENDYIALDYESRSVAGILQGPLYFTVHFDDGEPAEKEIVVTTASIANLTTENTTADLGKSYEIHKIAADKACRIRVYLNAAYRTADAARPIGEDPDREIEHGVIADIVLEASNLSWDLSPIAAGSNRESVRSNAIPIAIENRSGGGSSAVQVTFTVLKHEV